MITRKLFVLGGAAIATVLLGCAREETPETDTAAAASVESSVAQDFVPEMLPHHLQSRVEAANIALAGGKNMDVAFQLISRLKIWSPNYSVLRVCFFRGGTVLRERIVKVAKRWLDQPIGVSLDFGAAPGYRDCIASGDDHIRVGFRYPGNWSLVGQDSYEHAGQMEQSMNFQGFLVRTPPEEKFNRLVLHEFGHALGFEHEHQHPWSNCENEFDMPAIVRELSGPPNNWDAETIEHNMKELSADDKVLSEFDPKSVMLYHFPPRFYKEGRQSSCYTPENFALAPGDLAMLARIYPVDRQLRIAAQAADVNSYLTAFKAMPGGNAPADTAGDVAALTELVKLTDGRLPSGALSGLPVQQLPKELRDARPMQ